MFKWSELPSSEKAISSDKSEPKELVLSFSTAINQYSGLCLCGVGGVWHAHILSVYHNKAIGQLYRNLYSPSLIQHMRHSVSICRVWKELMKDLDLCHSSISIPFVFARIQHTILFLAALSLRRCWTSPDVPFHFFPLLQQSGSGSISS